MENTIYEKPSMKEIDLFPVAIVRGASGDEVGNTVDEQDLDF